MSDQLCKKIKRIREPKFTEKRNPYKKYQNANWTWTDIFTEIDELKYKIDKGFQCLGDNLALIICKIKIKIYFI